jgi:hypothetical protein
MKKILVAFLILLLCPSAHAAWGNRLMDSYDVRQATPTNGQVLVWNSTTKLWTLGTAGAAQTPWTGNVNGGGFALSNATGNISMWTNDSGYLTSSTGLLATGATTGATSQAQVFTAPTTGRATINLAPSSAVNPNTPNSGDMWWNGTNLYFYNGASNKDLLAGGGGASTADHFVITQTDADLTQATNLGGLTTGLLKGTTALGVSTISAITDNSANWNTAYGWGNWASNFGTTAGTIAQGSDSRITNGQTAYGWGNWASNFGTTAGTIAQGNDSRIADGETAYGWGNHAGLYLPIGGGTLTGDLALTTHNITLTGSLGATGAGKLTKGWFTDLEITNLPTINGGTLATALGNYGSFLTSSTGLLATGATTGATGQAQAFTDGITVGVTTQVSNLNSEYWQGNHFADYLDQAVKTSSVSQFAALNLVRADPYLRFSPTVGDAFEWYAYNSELWATDYTTGEILLRFQKTSHILSIPFGANIVPLVNTITTSATPSINVDTTKMFTITALSDVITNVGITGSPKNGQTLIVRILDAGVAKSITWGAAFKSIAPLPTTSVVSKTLYVGFVYSTATNQFECISSVQE